MYEQTRELPIAEQAAADELTVGICEESAEPTNSVSDPVVPPKNGRVWPPFLILGILFVVGITLFFMIDLSSSNNSTPWFSVQNGVLYFDKALYTGGSEITVPATINGQAVTQIGEACFADCSWVTTVHLPDGITAIGDGAFVNCTALRGIKIPETAETLGEQIFDGCSALEAVCIPYSVTSIGDNAFDGCSKLSYVFYTGPKFAWLALKVSFPDSKPLIYCHGGQVPVD